MQNTCSDEGESRVMSGWEANVSCAHFDPFNSIQS